MSKRAFEFEIYVPAYKSNGTRVSPHFFKQLRKKLVKQFGGLTDFRYRNLGIWKLGKVNIHDEIIIMRVMASSKSSARKYLSKLKRVLAKQLQQKEILIVERGVVLL